jgi:hypothetical protein
MAGRGPAPKDKATRRTRAKPIRGEWSAAPGIGWQHGPIPPVPDGLLAPSREAWDVWMKSWVAAHWTPTDLPGLRQLVRLYDQVERGEFTRAGELRLAMDTYGITPKGQQDRRWSPPKEEETAAATPTAPTPSSSSRYAHLRAIG